MRWIFAILVVFGMLLSGCPQEDVQGGGGSTYSSPSPSETCTDTDGGKDEFQRGTVTSAQGGGTDTCLESGKVEEYYCAGSWGSSEEISCPEGYLCHEGECRESTCFDTDGGAEPGTKGTVQYNDVQYHDECIDDEWVREYSCQDGLMEEAIQCGENEECSGGKCVALPGCHDSDGGENIYEGGTTTYGDAEYEDYCLTYNVVYEYYCEDGVFHKKQVMCPDGDVCTDGVCTEGEERECKDTDDGKSTHKKGKVTYWSGDEKVVVYDKCYDQYSVLENWCTDTETVGFGIIECDADEWCEDGECTSG